LTINYNGENKDFIEFYYGFHGKILGKTIA